MSHLVVLSAYPKRVEANRHHWGEFTVFNPGLVGLRRAHLDLALHAVRRGWGARVHVIQDDVLDIRVGTHVGQITSYYPARSGREGRVTRLDHVCPRSFTASEEGWMRLVDAWSNDGKTCELWPVDWVDPILSHDRDLG